MQGSFTMRRLICLIPAINPFNATDDNNNTNNNNNNNNDNNNNNTLNY